MLHNQGLTTNDLFRRTCARYPETIALVDGSYRYSYAALNDESNKLANAILNLGVKKGDRVAICAKNCKEFVFTYLALAKIGAVMIPLNHKCVATELEYMLRDCEAGVLLFETEYSQSVAYLKHHLAEASKYISIGSCDFPFAINYDLLVFSCSIAEPNVDISEDDECGIIYTSGTTGKPKGAIYTHRTRVACTVNTLLGASMDMETILLAGPLFHAGTLNAFLTNLAIGATTIIIPRHHPEDIAQTIEAERVNHLLTVPTVLHNLIEIGAFDKFDFSSLRKIRYGGSSISLTDLEILVKKLPQVKFFQGYGGTETTQLTVLSPEDHIRKFECTGKAHLLVDLRVVDETTGQDVAPGNVGEVITRGPHIIKGYLNLPEENKRSFRNGWFHTEDIARIDEDGFITIIGRKGDMIISGGENIYPEEVEKVLIIHPKIKGAAVFGIPDEKWGQSVCAAVIVRDNEVITEEEIINYCKENLASYKKPSKVRFFKSFPLNTSGKILKNKLKEAFLEGMETP